MTDKELKKYIKNIKKFSKIVQKNKDKRDELLIKTGIWTKKGILNKNYR